MSNEHEELLDAIIDALPAWQVLVVQFNEGVARQLGISTSDLQCLFVLSTHGPRSPGFLAEQIGLTTGSASRMVDRLLAAGLVTRETDAQDRRRVIVTATPLALARVADHYSPLNEQLRAHLSRLPERSLTDMLGFVQDAEITTRDRIHQQDTGA
ncbi:MarR family winged helix-turn-helix transcriptional regulator [Microbacterium aurugineum]|uniref:MarR family winged helix-turn-helix transcriptional regulator n=1 Tax=Microbacterium aurugineum TaxID=2851642 RepID=UPI0020C04200|nr:MarR family transcriptional regulator [Microbacterium aurugineum]MCK8475856.1 MarR family transcriptional regulator [Microbacterium aurugineum]